MASFDPKLVTDFRQPETRQSQPAEQPKPPELDLLATRPVVDPMEQVRRKIETERPDLHFIPLTPEELAKAVPGQPKLGGGRFVELDLDDDGNMAPEEDCKAEANDIDYERVFKGDGFDSFDYVYDKTGRIVGVVIPKKDYEEEERRTANAIRFVEDFQAKLERRIGGPLELSDQSELVNKKESILKRIKKSLGISKRPKIHSDDEFI